MLNFCCDLDREHSNQIFLQDTPAYANVTTKLSLIAKEPAFQKIQ